RTLGGVAISTRLAPTAKINFDRRFFMPPARKSTRSSLRKSAAFKEPAALKKLNQSLEAAQKALTELRQHAGGKSSKSLHTGVGKFVSSAKRDSGKMTTALKRDFAEAQKTA